MRGRRASSIPTILYPVALSCAFVIVILLGLAGNTAWKRARVAWEVKRLKAERLMRRDDLKVTLEKGFVLQSISSAYRARTRSYPNFNAFTNLAYQFYKDLHVPALPYCNRVVSNFDGQGGWLYEESAGVVLINTAGTFLLDTGRTVELGRILFFPTPQVPRYSLDELGITNLHFDGLKRIADEGVAAYLSTGSEKEVRKEIKP